MGTTAARQLLASIAIALTGSFGLAYAGNEVAAPPQLPPDYKDLEFGTAQTVEVDFSDDVPLPQKAPIVVENGVARTIGVAGGDPFYLDFWTGRRTPPPGERIDAELLAASDHVGSDRPTREVFGFVMFAKRQTPQRLAELEAMGVRFLGFFPWHAQRAAIPVDKLAEVANHPSVRWIGVAAPAHKLHASLARRIGSLDPDVAVDVWITLFDTDLCAASVGTPIGQGEILDPGQEPRIVAEEESPARTWQSHGWQQHELEARGVTIHEYVRETRAFRASLRPRDLNAVLAFDAVLGVEPVVPIAPQHDESMPMMGVDATRATWSGASGAEAVVGMIDTGVSSSHEMFAGHSAWGWNLIPGQTSAFSDSDGHGTHIACTMLGDPPAAHASFRGVAPKTATSPDRRFRVVRTNFAPWSYATWFQFMRNTLNDGLGNISPKPYVVNNSWSSTPNGGPASNPPFANPAGYVGTESGSIAVDQEVWNENQVYVFSAGNYATSVANPLTPFPGTLSMEASAKNSLAVGNVCDAFDANNLPLNGGKAGGIFGSSSRGPCGDGRWKPDVVAPGSWINSANAAVSNGYTAKAGTSFAAPHVTGLVAQLVDHYATLQYKPAAIKSLLMATAQRPADLTFSYPVPTYANIYGAGRVDAIKAHGSDSHMTTTVTPVTLFGTGALGSFAIPAGVKRIVVCLTYIEPAASSTASLALVNDLDLYVDQSPFSPNLNQGEWKSISSKDNTEILTIDNPTAGSYQWKIDPYATTTEVRCGVSVHIVYGDPTPAVTLDLNVSDAYVKQNDDVWVWGTVSNPDYVASNVYADTVSHGGATKVKTSTTLKDGPVTDLTQNLNSDVTQKGFDVMLGEILHGQSRTAEWHVQWPTDGVKTWTVFATCENGTSVSKSVVVTVDTVGPTPPTSAHSTSHVANVWSNATAISFAWNASTDALSGVDGYSVSLAGSPSAPDTVKDINAVTTWTTTVPGSGTYWFNIRAIDKCGNAGSVTAIGPFVIDVSIPNPAQGLQCSTLTQNLWSKTTLMTCNWIAATDLHSGIDGYSVLVSANAPILPAPTKNLNAVTTYSQNLGSGTNAWYFNLRSVDKAGNWDDSFVFIGPFKIDNVPPSAPTVNSNTHVLNTWSELTTVSLQITATDALSGIDEFAIVTDQVATTVPTSFGSIPASFDITLTTSASPFYVHVRANDLAGNLGPTTHFGPLLIDDGNPFFGSVTIQQGLAFTTTPIVSLQLNASNAVSGLAQMRFVNDGGVFSAWEPFSATKAWVLTNNGGSSAKGTRSVIAQVKDVAGNVTQNSDTIHWYTQVSYIGTPCQGSLGAPVFTIDGIPAFGETVTFKVTNTAATIGALFVGVSTSFWGATPLPLFFPNTSCAIYTSLDAQLYTGPVFPIPAAIPALPQIVGIPLTFQWLLGGDVGSPNTIVTTRAATMTISGP